MESILENEKQILKNNELIRSKKQYNEYEMIMKIYQKAIENTLKRIEDIKQELNKASKLANKELVKYELIGYLASGNVDIVNNKNIRFATESDYNINRFSKLLTNLNINHNIDISRKMVYYNYKD